MTDSYHWLSCLCIFYGPVLGKALGLGPLGNAKSALRLSSLSVIVSEGATMNGRRLVPRQRVVTLCNNICKGGMPMLTIEGLIAVLSFGLACFELGYTIGNKSQKK